MLPRLVLAEIQSAFKTIESRASSVSLELVNHAQFIVTWDVSLRLGKRLVKLDCVFLAWLKDDNTVCIFDAGNDCTRQTYGQSMGNKIMCKYIRAPPPSCTQW